MSPETRLPSSNAHLVTAVVSVIALFGFGFFESSAQERVERAPEKMGRNNFRIGRVEAEYVDRNGQKQCFDPSATTPVSVATADVNHDGYPDLIAGYATADGGLLVVYLANPEALAPTTAKSLSGISRGEFPSAFEPKAVMISVPTRPDMLAAGDFNGDGAADLLFATHGGRSLFVLPGDGNGHFGAPQFTTLRGRVTALITGSLHRTDPGLDVVVGVEGETGSAILVFDSAAGGMGAAPAAYAVGGSIADLAIGDFDGDSYRDVALVAGNRLMILHGQAARQPGNADQLETLPLSFGVSAVAAGHFAGDGHSTQIAVLTQDRGVTVLSRPESQAASHVMSRAAGGAARTGSKHPEREPWRRDRSQLWVTTTSAPATGTRPAKLFAARLPGSPGDDLLVADAVDRRVTVMATDSRRSAVGGGLAHLVPTSELDTKTVVVAVLPMRLNVMGSIGLVVLTSGDPAPITFASQAGVTYHVTTLGDSQNGSCATPSGTPLSSSCTTLRSAIIAANANPGQDLVVFDTNGTITLSVPGQDDNAQAGDLDVTDALTIVGNGAANTIIQGGTNGSNGIDKVFSFNPLGLQPGFAVSISGLTIQYGRNTFTNFSMGDDEGGGFDFDAGSPDGAGSLSVSNCNILNNSTLNGDGGAIALFNGGTVTITNTTIAGNNANTQDPNAWYGFYGGGIFVADPGAFASSISITNSAVSTNTLSATNPSAQIQLGGGICSFAPSIGIHSTTISGNQANGDGGGLFGSYGTFTIDQGSLISGNVSGGFGGGVYGVSVIAASSLINNSAAVGGGGLYGNGPSSAISNSRIVGNSSTQGSPAVDGDSTMGATVTAANNWWGSNNSPASLVNPAVVTFSPWLVMTFAASPTSVYAAGSSTLTAAINTGSDGSSGFHVADGTPVTFSGSLGTVAPGTATTTSGTATSTYTAGAGAGTASVGATTDSQTLSASLAVTIPPPPTLTSLTPNSGVQGATVPVTLTGTNFVAGATVAAGNPGIAVSSVKVVNATQITATFTIAANAAPGVANVTVTTSGGASSAAAFTVNSPAPAPTLTSMSALGGAPGAIIPVILTGTNFMPFTTVAVSNPGITIGGVTLSTTQISADLSIDQNAALGPANVTVITSGGTSNPVTFTVSLAAPVLTSISPSTATLGSTVVVTLTGTNFVSGATIALSDPAVTVGNVTVVSSTEIDATFTIPANPPQNWTFVMVTTSNGTSNAAMFGEGQPAPFGLSGTILSKSGASNARDWRIAVGHEGAATVSNVQIAGLTLTQTFGAACTPVIATTFPVTLGTIVPNETAAGDININFAGCVLNARFSMVATFVADGGTVTETMARNNQFQ